MRACLLICCIVVAGQVSAGDPGAAVYSQFPDDIRPDLVKAYEQEIRRVDAEVSAATKALAKARGPAERESAKQARDKVKAQLAALKEKNDPPFVGCEMRGVRKVGLSEEQWGAGSVGLMNDPVKVVQVTNDNSAVVFRINGKQLVIVEGLPTSEWSDNEIKSLSGPWWITGTKKFRTATGGQQILPVAEPFDWKKYRQSVNEKSDANK